MLNFSYLAWRSCLRKEIDGYNRTFWSYSHIVKWLLNQGPMGKHICINESEGHVEIYIG
jgi:hypothetical protein